MATTLTTPLPYRTGRADLAMTLVEFREAEEQWTPLRAGPRSARSDRSAK